MSEWIKTIDRLPVHGDNGLCAMHSFDKPENPLIVTPFTFLDGNFHPFADECAMENDDYWIESLYWPTHWMPLPSPPIA